MDRFQERYRMRVRVTHLILLAVVALAVPADADGQDVPAAVRSRIRADSARLPYTTADIRFISGMIGHHAQAVTMTALVPARTTNAAIRTLAARIANAQRDEIAIMERWLRERGLPIPTQGHDDHASHGPAMPGMLTPSQLRDLTAARDDAFDRLFLRLMIQHHEGAVVIVTDLFATDGAAQDQTVFRFASDVQVDQRTEIARMQRMLAGLLFADHQP
jgi:uncharacterized protein (DUF305 family)